MTKTALWLAAMLILTVCDAHAQRAPGPGQRPFDLVTGIVFSCSGATGYAWTGAACDNLAAEFRKRGEANKLPFAEVLITADFKTKKRDVAGGFDQDKAVRVFWNFVADTGGRISAGLSANRIWEPTAKEIANIVPGQRIPVLFYTQSALFDPGVNLSKAEPVLKELTDNFFEVGEKRN